MSELAICRDCYAETLRAARLLMIGPDEFDRGLGLIRSKGSEAVEPLLFVLRDAIIEALTGDHDCPACVMDHLMSRAILGAEFGEEHNHD